MHVIHPPSSQLRTYLRTVAIKYIGPLIIFKIIDLHNYLLIILEGKLIR